MVPDHWSNDAMVSMDRSGLVVKKGEQYTNFSPFFSIKCVAQAGSSWWEGITMVKKQV